ncbi:MAG: AIR synthase-related protein [Candidatus Marinimicrobia bacterium]|jgi:hypothetical protein|nr:AIR synthase-related protein [Candidatus Neomarinimicrobiota bacterium]MDP6611086.1 AIR synthase-related protein [Candidatus Neomarinimicrobiota bacterium]|tara:strand:+ start:7393 stop:9078 length:1686 start_codon:yes stop_codon:yes gene_type:complete
MNLVLIQKHLGRIPNSTEKLFLQHFWKSYQNQICFNLEISQSEFQPHDGSNLVLIAQGKSDPRKIVAKHVIHALNGQAIAKVTKGNDAFILGYSESLPKYAPGNNLCVYFISGSKIKQSTRELHQNEWLDGAIPVHKGGLGFTLYQLLNRYRCGIEIEWKHKDEIKILSKVGAHGLLILIKRGGVDQFQSLLKKTKVDYIDMGHLTSDSKWEIFIRRKSVLHIPNPVLDILVQQAQGFEELKMQTSIPNLPSPKLKSKKSYNRELIKLVKDHDAVADPYSYLKSMEIQNAVYTLVKNRVRFGMALNDNHYINYNDYKMKSIAAIANSARQLACAGIRPEICSGFIYLTDVNQNENGSFLKGIHDAGQILNISIEHLSFTRSRDLPQGEFCTAGTCLGDEIFPGKFREPDQFISIVGSHRGELGGSRYLSLLKKEHEGNRPIVDLIMESRLQEAILTGIQGKLIQSARAVGRGGIAVSIANSLEINNGLGARIHFSRRLKPEELLFGETQGLVLVTVKEADLMEFERVCMTIGVPATTIGRVTEDGNFTFNELIKLPVKKFN